MHNATATTWEP
jgi:hypothetical protein